MNLKGLLFASPQFKPRGLHVFLENGSNVESLPKLSEHLTLNTEMYIFIHHKFKPQKHWWAVDIYWWKKIHRIIEHEVLFFKTTTFFFDGLNQLHPEKRFVYFCGVVQVQMVCVVLIDLSRLLAPKYIILLNFWKQWIHIHLNCPSGIGNGGIYIFCYVSMWSFIVTLICISLTTGELRSFKYVCWPFGFFFL